MLRFPFYGLSTLFPANRIGLQVNLEVPRPPGKHFGISKPDIQHAIFHLNRDGRKGFHLKGA